MKKTFVHQILITDLANAENYVPKATKTIKKFFGKDLYEYVLWDKTKTYDFLSANFDKKVLAAYNKLKPYAYKSDLARYCIAYIYGGWYVDVNIEIAAKPPKMDKFDMCLMRDYNNHTRLAPWQVANGLFYTVPKHPALKIAIDMVVDNVENDLYGKRTLSVSGPEIFGRALAKYGFNNKDTDYLIGDFQDHPKQLRKHFVLQGKTFALHKQFSGGVVGVSGTNNYVDMWHSKDVYASEAEPAASC